MGNRVYVTLIDENKSIVIYQHWNGGLDSYLPIVKTAFEINQKNYRKIGIEEFLAFLNKMEFRPEIQESPDAFSWIEENGHYIIDFKNSTMLVKNEQTTLAINNFRDEFNKYNTKKIKEEYRQQNLENYWFGLQNEATIFFMDLPKNKKSKRKAS